MGFLSSFLSSLASAAQSAGTKDADGGYLPESEFEAAVQGVAADSWGVSHVTVTGPSSVEVEFYSQSRKSTWNARLDFDPTTWNASGTSMYPHSGRVDFFARAVRDRMLAG